MNFNLDFSFSEIKRLVDKNIECKKTFRYFDSRTEECFDDHIYHFILEDPEPVGYGHLDFGNNKLWLGMCVFDEYVGKGYGKTILENLIYNKGKNKLYLSVDKNNFKALNLYIKNGFKIYDQTDIIFYCFME